MVRIEDCFCEQILLMFGLLITKINSQRRGESQNCRLQSLSTFSSRRAWSNDATTPPHDECEMRYLRQVSAVELIWLKSHRNVEVSHCCCLLLENKGWMKLISFWWNCSFNWESSKFRWNSHCNSLVILLKCQIQIPWKGIFSFLSLTLTM